MKYMLLVYGVEDDWTDEEREDCMQESAQLTHELHARQQYIAASPLQSVTMATSVRVREGRRLVTDGPFAETREQLGGYYVLDLPDLDAAIEVASRIPAVTRGTVEIRPIIERQDLPKII